MNISKLFLKKISITTLIIIIYIFGRKLEIPNIKNYHFSSFSEEEHEVLESMSTIMGGGLESTSIFTLGLGPLMSSLVIWRLVSIIKKKKVEHLTLKQNYLYQRIIALLISILQSIVLIRHYEFTEHSIAVYGKNLIHITILLILVAGSMFLMWLASINIEYGLGGMIIIMLVNILHTWDSIIYDFMKSGFGDIDMHVVILYLLTIIIILVFTVLLELSEYRIKIIRILFNNKFVDKSYIPIKINPAGGMAFMYVMVIMILPQYLFLILNIVLPNNDIILWLIDNLLIGKKFGTIVYLILLFVLSLGFTFLNIDVENIFSYLKKTGDYIEKVRPGLETEKHMLTRVYALAFIGSTFVVAFAAVPIIIFNDFNITFKTLSLPGIVMIITTLTLQNIEELKILKITKKYSKKLFDKI